MELSGLKVLVSLVASFVMLSVFGCGSSGPSGVAESFIKARENKDCTKMVDLMDPSAAGGTSRDKQIESCQQEMVQGDIGDYKMLEVREEQIDGDRAEVKIDVTSISETVTDTLILYKKNGEWKVNTSSLSLFKKWGLW